MRKTLKIIKEFSYGQLAPWQEKQIAKEIDNLIQEKINDYAYDSYYTRCRQNREQ